jgi:streptogramin lyase
MSGVAAVGTSSTNALGLANAFAAVNKLVNIANGTVSGPALPPNATLPVAKIDTLADILAACINSSGGTAGSATPCGTLFSAATVGSSAPTDTIAAAMNIAQHPGVNVATLFGLANAQSPFQTTLATAPTDWSMVVTYTGGGLSTPKGVAADASGNVWLPNSGNNSVSEFSTTGAALSGSNGITVGSLNIPWGIAIDLGGNAWVANSGNNTVTEIVAARTSGTPFNGGGMSAPKALAVDGTGNVWIANSGNGSVTEISTSQTLTNDTGLGIGSALAIAIDPQ